MRWTARVMILLFIGAALGKRSSLPATPTLKVQTRKVHIMDPDDPHHLVDTVLRNLHPDLVSSVKKDPAFHDLVSKLTDNAKKLTRESHWVKSTTPVLRQTIDHLHATRDSATRRRQAHASFLSDLSKLIQEHGKRLIRKGLAARHLKLN